MVNSDNYMRLAYDLAGSRSKNRFRAEILWGVKKIFEIYEQGDFCIVFDYVCDIEIHTKNNLEFYQIKTHNRGTYSIKDITRKNKAGKSILGKLLAIKNKCDKIGEKSKVEIVSNVPLKINSKNIYNSIEEKEFINLSEKERKEITKELESENDIEKIDFNNCFYRYTTMDLLNPEKDIIADIVNFIEDIKKVTGTKIKPLYRLIYTKVNEKACYEFSGNDYEEIINNKGITKEEFDNMINKYIKVTDNSVEKASEYIHSKYKDNFQRDIDMIKALTSVVKKILCDEELKENENKILLYIRKNRNVMEDNIENVIEVIYDEFSNKFDIIYSEDEIRAFIILILYKLREGIYEENDNK